tara:strand:- start:110 stop:712 length:603 start_codon:yes stop_codon:yes gene_type:complete
MKLKTLLLAFLLTAIPSSYVFAWSHIDFTLSDFCYEQPNVQNRNNVYYFPNEEVGITANSICVFKDSYGQYQSKGKLKNGKEDGIWTTWFENGFKESEFNYIDGKSNGKGYWWWENGKMKSEGNFLDDEFDGKITTWWENGQMKSEQYFKNGVEDGRHTFWYINGQIKQYVDFKDGKCIGSNGLENGWCYFFNYQDKLPN